MNQPITLETSDICQPIPTIADAVPFPPADLWSDEPNLESDFHRDQIDSLIRILKAYWSDRQDFYVTGNLTVYYSPNQKKSEFFRGPDFFVALGTEKRDRRSWVVWQEDGKYPNVIVEILSDSTAAMDRGEKKQIYQDTWRTPDYFLFDPYIFVLEGFHLLDGQYQSIQPTEDGYFWSQQLGLYLGVHAQKLRFFTPDFHLVPSPEESAEQERQRAEQERQRAEQERQRADRMAAYLREIGIDPDQLPK
jgi:Uma2 family endonuclease